MRDDKSNELTLERLKGHVDALDASGQLRGWFQGGCVILEGKLGIRNKIYQFGRWRLLEEPVDIWHPSCESNFQLLGCYVSILCTRREKNKISLVSNYYFSNYYFCVKLHVSARMSASLLGEILWKLSRDLNWSVDCHTVWHWKQQVRQFKMSIIVWNYMSATLSLLWAFVCITDKSFGIAVNFLIDQWSLWRRITQNKREQD